LPLVLTVSAYRELSERTGNTELSVAVRSSATAEDLPDASFAGQQETFLNVVGPRRCWRPAAAATPRSSPTGRSPIATSTASTTNQVALSIGVQQMVRSDLSSSGVMFSIDTETGFDKFVLITGAWGLGENVVQGAVDPDEFQVFKPFLDNPDLKPIVARDLGAKEIKMIYGAPGEAMTRNVPTSKKGARHVHAVRRRGPGPRPHGQDHRGTLRPADGHGMGQGRRSPASSSSCRPGPKRCSRAKAPMCCRITP
jgi:pyruvate,water dikinase